MVTFIVPLEILSNPSKHNLIQRMEFTASVLLVKLSRLLKRKLEEDYFQHHNINEYTGQAAKWCWDIKELM